MMRVTLLISIVLTSVALGGERELNLFAWSEYVPQPVPRDAHAGILDHEI